MRVLPGVALVVTWSVTPWWCPGGVCAVDVSGAATTPRAPRCPPDPPQVVWSAEGCAARRAE
ncbi:hypothetical protein GCM10025792_35380 [Pseudonocardia tropica]